MNIELLKKDVLVKLVYFIFFLLFANITGIVFRFYIGYDYIYGLVPLFDFNTEKNIPTLYSSVTLLIAGFLLLAISLVHKKREQPWVSWMGLSVIFIFLSIDEMATIHERLIEPFKDVSDAPGMVLYAWVIPYGVALGVFVIAYLRFLINLPKKIMLLFLFSGITYVSGAIGFELLGGRHIDAHGWDNITYSILYTCEELLEMLGIAFFIYTLLTYITDQFSSFNLAIK